MIALQGLPTRLAAQLQFMDDEDIPEVTATFSARIEPAAARPGEHVRLLVTAEVADGWYIYSVVPQGDLAPPPTLVEVNPLDLEPRGPVYETNPVRKVDKVFNLPLAYHPRAARFYQNFTVPAQAELGERTIAGTVRYQTCNDRVCLPPRRHAIAAGLTIESGPPREPYGYMLRTVDYVDPSGSIRTNPDTLEAVLSGGLTAFLLLAMGFGLLALITPCVFPMIPVTVSFFAGVSEQGGRKTLKLALLFAGGIVVTYTGLGLILTLLLGAAGVSQFATSPWVNLAVALFFTLFAFSLMGLFNVALPSSLLNALEAKSRGLKGPGGVLVMGVAFTATSFTCTMPFVGTLLVAATQGHLLWPLVGMLVFSTVFAIPFFLLALFPHLVTHLRGRSGNWLIQVKVVLGLLELMAALKFLSNADLIWGWGIFDRMVVLALWAVLSLAVALVVAGWLRWPGVQVLRRSAGRMATAGVFLALALYFAWGLTGRELNTATETYLPPPLPGRMPAAMLAMRGLVKDGAVHALPWHTTLAAGLEQAKTEGKPVFIDFTGYTCVNCRWMEKEIFARQPVYEAFRDRFALVQLYTDGGEGAEENQRLQVERFRTLALPFYVILSPDNAVLARHSGIMADAGEFLDWLEQARRRMRTESPG